VSQDQTVSGREDLHISHKTIFTRPSSSTKSPNKIMKEKPSSCWGYSYYQD